MTGFRVHIEPYWPASTALQDLLIDEVLPHEHGCSHELVFAGGSIEVSYSDLTAAWADIFDTLYD